jgi:hypothetical protein
LQDLGQRMLGVEIVLYNQDGLLHGFPRVWHSVVGVAVNTSGEMNSAWGKALDNRMAPDQRVGFYNNTGRPRMQSQNVSRSGFRVSRSWSQLVQPKTHGRNANEKRGTRNPERGVEADYFTPGEN